MAVNIPCRAMMTMGIFLCFISSVKTMKFVLFFCIIFLCCCCCLLILFLLFYSPPLCMHTYRKNWVYQSRQHHRNKIFVNVVCVCICSKNLIKIPFHTGAAAVAGTYKFKSMKEREIDTSWTYCSCALMHYTRSPA